jgi:hypothetical protein
VQHLAARGGAAWQTHGRLLLQVLLLLLLEPRHAPPAMAKQVQKHCLTIARFAECRVQAN